MVHFRFLTPALLVCMTSLMTSYGQLQAADFIFGGEAKRVCKAYKMMCPSGKVCALQSIKWPRTMKFPVCVHEQKIVVKSRLCRKPPQPGKCGAHFVRWYFNVHMGSCSWFTYSGCGGNRNNFRTAAECERRCVGRDPSTSARRDRRRQGTTDVIVEEGGKSSEPITAGARAAEDLDLDVSNSGNKNKTRTTNTTDAAEERRRRKELRRKARKERRRRRKELEKRMRANRRNQVIGWRRTIQVTTPRPPTGIRRPSRKLTLLELGPNYGLATAASPSQQSTSSSPTGRVINSRSDNSGGVRRSSGRGYVEARGRGVTRYDPDLGKDTPIWLMDELLNQDEARRAERRRRRHRNRNNRHNRRDKPRRGRAEMSREGPQITITVQSFPTSSRQPGASSSNTYTKTYSSSKSRGRNSRTPSSSYNQRHRSRNNTQRGTTALSSSRLADAPTPAEDTKLSTRTRKSYYDKHKLFNILEDPKNTKI